MLNYQYQPAKNFDEGITNLYTIIKILRSDQGCLWDREQQPDDIARALISETYEYIEALRSDNLDDMAEELGDLLLNAMMALYIHRQEDQFAETTVFNAICEKLIRRHPHVFGDVKVTNSSDVKDLWDTIKIEVEGRKASSSDLFSRVPKELPQLEKALEIQKIMAKAGFDWNSVEGVVEKIKEELAELEEALATPMPKPGAVEEELGDLLFAVVNLARFVKISPSAALYRANKKLSWRFNRLVEQAQELKLDLISENIEELEAIWQAVKKEERN